MNSVGCVLVIYVQVALASGEEASLIEIVREAQLGVDFLNVRTVDAKGLPLEPDGLHLTTPAQVQLGKMLADAYLQFLPSAISHAPVTYPNYIFHFLLYLVLKVLTTSQLICYFLYSVFKSKCIQSNGQATILIDTVLGALSFKHQNCKNSSITTKKQNSNPKGPTIH